MEMSKSEFAAHIGVVPSRITKMIADGIIGQDALAGEGRSARIIVDLAKSQIALRRDPSQALGNGLKTQLDLAGEEDRPSPPQPSASPRRDDVAHAIQIERLEAERRRNRRDEVDEQERMGRLLPVAKVRTEMTRLATAIDSEYEAMLADMASAIAARFELPQRDVLHLLRQVRAEKKAEAAERARQKAADTPEKVEMAMDLTSQ